MPLTKPLMHLQLKARCEELKLDWSTLSLESLLKEKQALKNQISEKQKHCLELQVEPGANLVPLACSNIQPVFQFGHMLVFFALHDIGT